MKSQSTINPQIIELQYSDSQYSYFYLRKNVVKNSIILDEKNNITQDMYDYDEVKLKIYNRANSEQYIQDNFDSLWLIAEKQLAEEELRIQKEQQIYKMINGLELPEQVQLLANQLIDRELDTLVLGQQYVELELRLLKLEGGTQA